MANGKENTRAGEQGLGVFGQWMRVFLTWYSMFDPTSEDLNKNKPKPRTKYRRGSSMKKSEVLFQIKPRETHRPYWYEHTSK